MSSKAITEKPDQRVGWQSVEETAPSVLAADEPTVARIIGFIGLLLFVLGAVAVGFSLAKSEKWIGGVTGTVFALFGLCGLLYHVARETDTQIRRVYGVLGGAGLVAAAIFCAVYPFDATAGKLFLPWGIISLAIALMFLLPAVRGETEESWRKKGVLLIGVIGLAAAGTALIGGNISPNLLLPLGALLGVVGLAYLWSFISFHGTESDLGHRAATLLGVAGGIVLVVAVARSLLTRYGWLGVPRDLAYLPSTGIVLVVLGGLYAGVAWLASSDRTTAILTRRELASFFFSPLAYVTLIGFALMGWFAYLWFVRQAGRATEMRSPLIEPIISVYFFNLFPVICFILVVPLMTMRLLSEEQRTQTLEVLMTAPVQETPVVLAKFLAALILLMLAWVPYGLYLIALRVESGQAFDYRPLISFSAGLLVSSAGCVAMGLFFSSVTRSQMAAFVMTAMAMVLLTFVYFAKEGILRADNAWQPILTYFSFIHLWQTTLDGKLSLADIGFNVSVVIFWLYLTVKVLESRKWR
jgi:ABC-type transport system involved in multi-copper enzyme maturation permease subunit